MANYIPHLEATLCDQTALSIITHLSEVINNFLTTDHGLTQTAMFPEIEAMMESSIIMHKQINELSEYCAILRKSLDTAYEKISELEVRGVEAASINSLETEGLMFNVEFPIKQTPVLGPILDENGCDIVAESIEIIRSVRSSQKFEELSASVGASGRKKADPILDGLQSSRLCFDAEDSLLDDSINLNLTPFASCVTTVTCFNDSIAGTHQNDEAIEVSVDGEVGDELCQIISNKLVGVMNNLNQQQLTADRNALRIRRLEEAITVKMLEQQRSIEDLSSSLDSQSKALNNSNPLGLIDSYSNHNPQKLLALSPNMSPNKFEKDMSTVRSFNKGTNTCEKDFLDSSARIQTTLTMKMTSPIIDIISPEDSESALSSSLHRIALKLREEEAYLENYNDNNTSVNFMFM